MDVAIVGGGPGGAATALSLRAHAPSLSVSLIEASAYDTPRLGETLPPIGQQLLEHLGVWEAFQREPHQPSYGTIAAWGSPAPHEQSFIYSPYGRGWHLDRRTFDAWLAAQAETRGVRVHRSTRVSRIERRDDGDPAGGGWRLILEPVGGPLRACHARVLVDATGAAAGIARAATAVLPGGTNSATIAEPQRSARTVAADHLVAFARMFDAAAGGRDAANFSRQQTVDRDAVESGVRGAAAWPRPQRTDSATLVEACRDGWWYTATLPNRQRIVACFTDPDIARDLRLAEPVRFAELLAQMPLISRVVGAAPPFGPLTARSAGSRYLTPAAGDTWLAVGDAASVFDPLSSQGMLKALRSGVFASYAIADRLVRHDATGFARYDRYIREEFQAYLTTRTKYYAEEQRWPASPFWARRHSSQPASRSRALAV